MSWNEIGDALWLAAAIKDADTHAPREAEPDDVRAVVPAGRDEPAAPAPEPPEPTTPEARPPHRMVAGLSREAVALLSAGSGTSSSRSAPALPGATDILRALRALKLTRSSEREEDVVLDEDLTAEAGVDGGIWLPVTVPGRVRALDLTVVIDSGPSMALWQQAIDAFLAVLRQLGAFRSIRVRLLTAEGDPDSGPVRPVLRGGTSDAPARRPAELLDPTGHRVLLVLTDGAGRLWYDDLVAPMLAQWGRTMPVALVHLLPQWLWSQGGLNPQQALLVTPGPLRPNGTYGVELPDAWLTAEEPPGSDARTVPIPLLELDARWLGWWAGLITRPHREPLTGTVLLVSDEPNPMPRMADERAASATPYERVQRFRGVASEPAFRLAKLLAAVPVSLPIARFVQTELVPGARTTHLAEVFTSGLLEMPADTGQDAWDEVVFEIAPPVRAALLAVSRRSETADVVIAATDRFGAEYPVLVRLRDALADPDEARLPARAVELAPEVRLEQAVMRALSGPYLARADRLRMLELELAAAGPPVTEKRARPVDDEAEPSPLRPGPVNTDSPVVMGEVPSRNPAFVGRRGLLESLARELDRESRAVLHGMGGIGKTQLAIEYVHRHLQEYDVVWWIRAAQEMQIRASLTELARQLHLPGADESVTAVPAVLEALRTGSAYSRWLLVFDSAGKPERLAPFLPDGPGRILITSREPDWADTFAEPLEVSLFDRGESKELLCRRDPVITDEQADQLAGKLGDLPLALAQAATWRAETGMPIEEYLRLFDEKVAEILEASPPAEYEVPIAAAWSVSFDQLRTLDPAAHQLLQVCAFFAPEPISRNLFTGVHGVSIAPELDIALRDPMRLGRVLRDINRCGLARLDHRSDTLLLHRLVQLVLRNRMSPAQRTVMRHGAHMLLAKTDPNSPASTGEWPRYQEIVPHMYAAELIGSDEQWVRRLVINLMKFLYHWGDHQGAVALARRAVRRWSERSRERNDERPDPQTLEASERLGFFLCMLGGYAEAAEINQRTLRLYREIADEDSEEVLNAQLSVAVDKKAAGEFFEARDLNLRTYAKATKLFGVDDPVTLDAASDLVVSWLLTGEYEKAHRLCTETYRLRHQVLGQDNAATITTLTLLVISRRELGDFAWARVEQERLVKRVRELFGEGTVGVLRRNHFLAVARRKDGDYPAALTLSDSALKQFRLSYGEGHPNAMACALAHSIDLRHAGRLDEALELGLRVLELYRRSLGEHHPHTLVAEVDLAVTLRQRGSAEAATQQDERSFERLRGRLGDDHPHVIASATNLANGWYALGEFERALLLDTEVLLLARHALGEHHPGTLATRLNRALDLQRLGRTPEGRAEQLEVVARIRRVLRNGHPMVAATERGIRAECDIDPMPL
ncbi:FxSxx-COOH system tetratricopeptide repeat protein [Amycolatopsis sp. NBRC 101858]|uniref:FxSxx-COOH system tetratricopeptide repeat protein n=1 Tax=Amycolatopsis sp. NBRC 101858 TaxID=3032200 RepID=UPI00255218AB|nr:FxSxx-COOH system tetratricopeptide repeat protein [Amycolatopsis sp. NBRC 101858]